jgi:uncharacterized protein YcfJ
MPKNAIKATILALSVAVAASGLATTADARHRVRVQERVKVCSHSRGAANRGTVIGAIGGGLLGNAIGGHGAGGAIVGAGVGAVAGHEIGKNSSKRRCHYEVRWVYRYR